MQHMYRESCHERTWQGDASARDMYVIYNIIVQRNINVKTIIIIINVMQV